MTNQIKRTESSIQRVKLPEVSGTIDTNPLSYLSNPAPSLNEPSCEARVESLVANGVQQQSGKPGNHLQPQESIDKRSAVKRISRALNDPDRPFDPESLDHRLRQIQYLEKLFKAEFSCTGDMRQLIERYLEGFDGRRLPIPQAIKRARKKLKLTQQQLAETLGLRDHTLISKYETGRRVPSNKVIEWLKGGGM
jgi:DNA-binding transcriptional regulator YiaG